MTTVLRALASLKLTLAGLALFAVAVVASHYAAADAAAWLAGPVFLLALNFLAAIVAAERLRRRGGLLLFHASLLGLALLAAVGRLTFFEARLELTEGRGFDSGALEAVRRGPLHSWRFDRVFFVQGPFSVEYGPRLRRGPTRSHIQVPDANGALLPGIVGDDRPWVQEGYRFYTTHNKGFAPLLTWIPDHGKPVTGVVHMPSYPLFDWKQDNRWAPPGAGEIKFWLRLETGLDEHAAWILDSRKARGVLVVTSGERRIELRPGETARVERGRLRFDALRSWMGYKVFYDPTLPWMLALALAGVIGLAWHYWRTLWSRPWPTEAPSPERTDGAEALA